MKNFTKIILSANSILNGNGENAENEQYSRLASKYFIAACIFLLCSFASLTKSYAALTVTLSTPTSVPAANACQYRTNLPIYQFTLTSGGTGFTTGTFSALTFTQAGSATSGDIVQYKLWSGSVGGTLVATSTTASFSGFFVTFSSFTIAATNFFITADIAGTATVGNTIIVSPLTTANYTMSAGTTEATSGTILTGGTQTIIAGAGFTGASSICVGSTIALTGTPTGGTWATSTSTVATVSGGIVGGVAGGTSTISYTIGSCSATQIESVSAVVTPSVSISAFPAGAICAGTSVRLTATPTNGGTAATYQWYYNGSLAGAGPTLTSTTFANGDVVYCVMAASLPCVTTSSATSATMTLTVNPAATITTTGPTTVCAGSTTTLTGSPTGGIWATGTSTVATVSGGIVGGVLGGTSTITYTFGSCSATRTVSVSAVVTPSVSISAFPAGAVCAGTSVRFTATPTNGGAPTYQWYYNGSLAGAGPTLTSTSFVNGDVLYCVMASSLPCATTSSATSASVTMTVTPAPAITGSAVVCIGSTAALTGSPTGGTWSSTATFTIRATVGSTTGVVTGVSAGTTVISYTQGGCVGTQAETVSGIVTPSVTVTAFPAGAVCAGTPVTFTPIPLNGGTPTYQWYKNGSPVATTATYTSSTLSTGDVVNCIMTSTFPCLAISTATSNSITMAVIANATPSVPSLLASSATCQSINLNWAASPNAANYEVTIATGSGMTGIIYGPTLVGNVTSFTLSTGLTSGTNYYYQVRAENTCGGGYSALTPITTVATTAALPGLCECAPAGNLNCTTGEYIANVTITGTTLNNTTTCSPGGYAIYPASGSTTANLAVGQTYTLSATSGTTVAFGDGLEAFIDYSQSNSFSVADYIPISAFIFGANTVYSTAVTIPTTAAAGPTTMRVRYIGDGDGVSSTTACTSFGTHGETEDYTVCLYSTTVITAQPVASTTKCIGGTSPSLSVSASGSNLTYLWFNNGTTNSTTGGVSTGVTTATFNTASTAAAGTTYYYCKMTNACGITTTSNTAAVIVGSNPTITASAIPGTVCAGNTLSLNATPVGGSGIYASYSWSGPSGYTASTQNSTEASVTTSAAGVYSVTVTDNNGCTSAAGTTASVIVGTIPTITATALPTAVCAGNTLTLNATPTGGSGTYSYYTWSGPGGFTASTQNTTNTGMSALGVGVYSVTVTDNNGCTSATSTTASVTLNSLPVIITATAMPAALCAGGTLTLNATPAGGSGTYTSYSWSGPGGFSASTQNSINAGITTGGAGNYNVTVTDNNGCTSSAATTGAVVVNPLPIITATAIPTVLCAATTLTLNATPSGGSGIYLSFAWNGPGSFTSLSQNTTVAGITTAGTGTYSVTVTDNNGCSSRPGTTTVTVNASPTVTATATPNPVCVGKTLTLNATPAGGSGTYSSYTWTGPGGFSASTQNTTNPGISTSGVGIYSVSVTDNNGCTSASVGTTASVSLYAFPSITALATPTTMCAGSTLTLNSTPSGGSGTYTSFSWNGPGGFTASAQNATNASITTAGAGIYSVTVTDNNGCTSSVGATLPVTVNPIPNVASFSVPSATSLCIGGTSLVTVNSSSLAGAIFTVTYNLSGANTVTAHSATLTMSGGTGTFVIPSTDITHAGLTTVTITSVANGCVSSLSTGNSVSFNVNPGSAPIGGSPSVCLLSVITLSDATSLGTWSSSNTAVATIGASTGFLTGTAIGTATITYTLPTGCFTTVLENVNPIPNIYTVTGGGTFCSSSPTVHVGLSGSDLGASYQIYIGGIAAGGLITGTGGVMDFGLETVSGIYTVVANPSATCAVAMAGSVAVLSNLSPGVFTVTGGGSLCTGGTGVAVGMNYGQIGMSYQLYNGVSTAGSAVTGTGYPFNFGLETAAGTYTVIATNPSNSCTTTMAGSAVVVVNPLPPTIAGTASLCAGLTTSLSDGTTGGTWSSGGTGLAMVGSSSGIVSGINAGLPVITYTLPTGCTTTRQVTVNPTPATPGGASANVCSGSTVTMTDASSGGTWSSSNTAAAIIGSASGIVTGGLTSGAVAITYTLPAGCTSASPLTINSLPAVYAVTGGGSYCAGGTGSHIGLGSSATGISYQLYLGGTTASGSAVSGTGSSLDFGTRTTAGAYTVVATNSITGCSSNMSGSAIVAINPLPAVYTVSGGGSYCSGSTGVDVSLGFSAPGISYQLFDASTPIGGAVSGTGASYDFGLQTAGGVYGVIATNSTTGCISAMSGSAVVTVLPLPTAYAVSGGGSYCPGGTGVHILLSSSASGINYQVFSGGSSASGAVAGTGGSIDFGAFTATGIYTITGTNATTGCSGPMSGSVTVTTNPVPVTTYSVTGGGGYCAGASSTSPVGLSGSVLGTSYQLYVGGAPAGIPVPGTGGMLNFGIQSTAGVYTVIATTGTGCTGTMTGSATIAVNPLPAVFSITGGGSYCTGSAASVHVGLNGSATGVSYQLYNSGTAGAVIAGTGSSLDFGALPTGSYTIKATSGAGCVTTMSGSASVTINPLPAAFAVSITPGSNYCAGSAAPQVLLSGSVTGVTYQLILSGALVGARSGTGAALNFGAQPASGVYTVNATNTATGCSSNMTGSATVITNVLPTAYTVTGGGTYCAGGTGVPISLSNSTGGVSYQLYIGGIATGAAVPGSGSGISFPAQTATGFYSVIATNTATSCTNNMTGSVVVSTTPVPVVYNVTGGGAYCTGTTTGVHVGLSASDVGFNYQLLFGGTTAVGLPVSGTGSALDFGAQTTTGAYTTVATNTTTRCTNNMFGAAVVSTASYPTAYAVSASGSYCSGGIGLPVTLGSSDAAVSYQLLRGGVAVGSPVSGTGSVLNFGNQTVAGNYTVFATNAAGCGSNMTGVDVISINPLPTVFTVTGTGTVYCTGDTGVHIGLNSSVAGFSYQLYNGGVTDGGTLAGTGSPLDFGRQTAGVYTISARNNSTSCTDNMSGMIVVTANPLPVQYAVTGGGNYCSGSTGVAVGLGNSDAGISYQLYLGSSATGAAVAGTGLPLNFGLQAATGTYTVKATNTTTGCTQAMTGSATIGVSTLPALHNVSGGGNYCIGGTGVDVYIDGSNTGVSYQLYNGTTPVGTVMTGTGSSVHFGLQTAAGAYTVVASGGSACTDNMTGSVTVTISPLPAVYTVTGGGNYCPSGTGVHIGLSRSDVGVQYQLFNGTATVGAPLTGTGTSIDFGLQTGTGSYTVVATSPTTTCTNNMSGIVTIGLAPLPAVYNVTGGGSYCAGGTGVAIGTDGSAVGIAYQLYLGTTSVGSPLSGTGFPVGFGLQTAAGTYTVMATNTTTSCNSTMTGSAAIIINPLPDTFSVTGGGQYCAGTGGVAVGLRSSEPGISYQLYQGGIATGIPVSGTGAAISFGAETGAGAYTTIATNTGTTCSSNMPGSALVSINPLPVAYAVTGGGNYCPGGTGLHIGLSASAAGVTYALYNGLVPTGIVLPGTGAAIDFGSITTPGTYYVGATNTATSCTANMAGSAVIGISALPTAYTVSSSAGQYCAGGEGVNILLSGSATGTNYQLYSGTAASGSLVTGTGSPLNFGMHTAGVYTVVGTTVATGCVNNMAGSATVTVNPLPAAYPVAGGGNYCPGGSGVHVGLAGTTTGVSYQLYNGIYAAGSAATGTGSAIDFGLQTAAGIYTVVATNTLTGCSNNMTGSAAVEINPLPAVNTVTGGGNYCVSGSGSPVGLSGSGIGVTYQLYFDGVAIGAPVTGTGALLSFGLQTAIGTYTAVATNSATGCTSDMAGSAVVNTNSLPPAYAISGGGSYCAGGPGFDIGLANSTPGVNYQLYNGLVPSGIYLPGTGFPLDFGIHAAAGSYTLVGTNITTGCTSTMTGTAAIIENPLPEAYSVTGGGNYCASGSGVHIGLSNSQGSIAYQLFDGGTPYGLPVPGTGSSLDFGSLTAVGTYSVVATNPLTGCSANMTGTAIVAMGLPVVPLVTLSTPGADTLCNGTTVTISTSAINGGTTPTFIWTVNGVAVSATGGSFTYAPAVGDVVGVTMTSSAACASPVTASNTLPLTVLPHGMPSILISSSLGETVCQGAPVTFTEVTAFGGGTPSLSWMVNGTAVGSTGSFTYTPANGDLVTCVLTSDYRCRLATSVYSNPLNLIVNEPVTPAVTVVASPGTSLPQGQVLSLMATVTNAVIEPSFQWYINGEPIPGAVGTVYSTTTYSNLDSFSCIVTSGGGCSGLKGSSSAVIHIANEGVKQVTSSGSDIRIAPNPNNGIFTIKGSIGATVDEEVSIEITDMLGQVIYKDKAMAHGGNIDEHIQLNNKPANGMYILSIHSESTNDIFHVVIEQ